MTAANRLAKFGRKVLLLEQHFMLGGLAAYFKRNGHIFDVSLHGFPYGMVKTCRKYWSKEIASKIVQLKRIVFDNPQFHLETTFDTEDFKSKLINFFNIPSETVENFFTTLAKMNFYDDQSMTTRELFENFFPGRKDVVRFLMEPITYANGSTLDEPAITYGIVFSNFMNKGVYTFEGGTDLFINMLREELEKNGVEIRLKTEVKEILMSDGKAAGVVINGEKITAKSVISNASLSRTIKEMLAEAELPRDFIKTTEDMRISNSSTQVYIGIKEGESIEDIGDLIFTSTYGEFDAERICAKEITSRTFSIYYPKTRPESTPRYTIVASMNGKYTDWEDLGTEEYQKAKDNLCKETLKFLENYLPGVTEKVDYIEAATPRTFARYTGHIGGASFGTKFEGLKVSEKLPKVAKGVFHTGSCAIIMSGWLGAANYGVIVANQAEDYLYKLEGDE